MKRKKNTIYDRIVEVRREHGKPVTQPAIAKDLGIHQTAVHKWFAGKGDPAPRHVYQVALDEKVCVDWLFTGRPPKYPTKPDILTLIEKLNELPENDREEILRFAAFRAKD